MDYKNKHNVSLKEAWKHCKIKKGKGKSNKSSKSSIKSGKGISDKLKGVSDKLKTVPDKLKKAKNSFVDFVKKHNKSIASVAAAVSALGAIGSLMAYDHSYRQQMLPAQPSQPQQQAPLFIPFSGTPHRLPFSKPSVQPTVPPTVQPTVKPIVPPLDPPRWINPFYEQLPEEEKEDPYDSELDLFEGDGKKRKKGKGKITDYLKKKKNQLIDFIKKNKKTIAGVAGAIGSVGAIGAMMYNQKPSKKPFKFTPMHQSSERYLNQLYYGINEPLPPVPQGVPIENPNIIPSMTGDIYNPNPIYDVYRDPEQEEEQKQGSVEEEEVDIYGSGFKDFIMEHKGKLAALASVLGTVGAVAALKNKKQKDDLAVAMDVGDGKKRKRGRGDREQGKISKWISENKSNLKSIVALGALAIPVILWLSHSSPTPSNIAEVEQEIYG
jgi:hypothetical protein